MDTILFADGEERPCSFCATNPNEGKAYIALADATMTEAAAIFSDSAKTEIMEYGGRLLVGYTECIMLAVQPYGIQATLKGGHDESIAD